MGLSDPIYQAIEVAVKATGGQAVADLESKLLAAKAAQAAWEAQLKAGTITSATYIANTEKVHGTIDKLTESVAAAKNVLDGLPAKFDHGKASADLLAVAIKDANQALGNSAAKMGQANTGAQAAARGVLELSRGFEDLTTGGFLGVLNNIPGTIQNFGTAAKLSATQVGLLTAGASALGTVGYIVYQNWGRISALFGAGLPPKTLNDVKMLQEGLKELTEKTWKAAVDYQEIRNASEEIRKLTEQKSAYDRLVSGKTAEQQERSKAVSDAIIEQGGAGDYATGAENVARAIASVTPVADSEATAKKRAELAEMNRRAATVGEDSIEGRYNLLIGRPTLQRRAKVLAKELGDLEGGDRDNRLKGAKGLVGQAAGGNEQARARIEELIRQNPRAFAAQGATPGLGDALSAASPKGVAEKKRIDEAYEESIRAVDESIANVKGFFKGVRDATKRARDADKDAVDLNYRLAAQESQQVNDRRRAEGRDEKKDDSDKMKAMRSIAQSNQRRSRQMDPGKGPVLSAILQTQAIVEAEMGTFGEATASLAQIVANNEHLSAQANQFRRGVIASRTHRSHRPTNLPNIDQ